MWEKYLIVTITSSKLSGCHILNFDDIRLSGFEVGDFTRLHREIEKRDIKVLFFDEIQVVEEWEKYVNQLLRDEYKVFVTGSNASMLSVELGTHLTGRQLSESF
ncbi:MAG: hypothetical protein BGN96_11255 [Bacteroidales bacterium 45-6]|uniref:ATP-binding protein n=1 Tax=uncultured Dysgonomonas sp. TaxID=206096 RepID=UPI000960EED9|nr:AAA family ATPase [uncultured Dysgonomonas sp.]OJU49086.1 MAG: hypothetical protein BGN96_11255 [Bacteroidales bacterium 45-6]